MTYEEYLLALRDGQGMPTTEVRRVASQKGIAAEINVAHQFTDWLVEKAGGINLVTSGADAAHVVAQLKASGEVIGIDIETAKCLGKEEHPLAGLHPQLSKIRLVQLFRSREEGVYVIDCFVAGYDWLESLIGGRYVAHNAKFEASHLWQLLGRELDIDCTMLAGRVFDNQNMSLEHYAQEYLHLALSKELQVSNWSRAPLLDEQIVYAAGDAVVVKLLWQCLDEMFSLNGPSYKTAYSYLKRLVYPVVRQVGIGFDSAAHESLVAQWHSDERSARDELCRLGLKNPASVQQRQEWLKLQLSEIEYEAWPRTATGNLSTKADDLENAMHIAGARPLSMWSRASSRLSNYGSKLNMLLIDGFLYPNYSIAGMVTGRFGCTQPNLQNQPREGFKHVYRAPRGSNRPLKKSSLTSTPASTI